jgi:hypothetical protein
MVGERETLSPLARQPSFLKTSLSVVIRYIRLWILLFVGSLVSASPLSPCPLYIRENLQALDVHNGSITIL